MPALVSRPQPKAAQSHVRKEWLELLDKLFDDIAAWAETNRWPLDTQHRYIHEKAVGKYRTRVLNIKTPNGILIVEATARFVCGAGAQGRVDLYAFPSLKRVLLIWTGTKWAARYDSGVWSRSTWSEKTFTKLALDLTETS